MSPLARSLALVAALATLLVPLYAPSDSIALLACYIGMASLIAIGLVVLTGVGGMTSFGQAALMGIGSYTTAILCLNFGWSAWAALPVALALTGLVSFIVGIMTVRLSGHFLPLGTIAWGLALYYYFGASEFLGGYGGLSGIPPLSIGSVSLIEPRDFYPVIWVAVAIVVIITINLLDSRPGRVIRSLRSGRTVVEAFGASTSRLKLFVFIYAGVLAGLSGWLYALFLRAVSSSTFGLSPGIEYLLMAVIGGAGNVFGAIFGAAAVILGKNYLQDFLPLIFGSSGNYHIIVFGMVLVLLLVRSPDGIWPMIMRRLTHANPFLHKRRPQSQALERSEKPHAGNVILKVQALEKRYGGLVAVNNVDFEVAAGSIVGLIGPNGAGKSTTFNLITGIVRPSSGEVNFLGESLGQMSSRAIARRRIARTFQHVKLVNDMSVLENVAVGGHLRSSAGPLRSMLWLNRREEARIKGEAMSALERVGLADLAFQETGSLALGQMRVVEIARALCMDPVLLLLDEPAAGLRFREKQALLNLLRSLASEGVAILIVEHDMQFVMDLTDRLIVLNFGTKLAEGPPDLIQKNPDVLAAYLGVEE